MALSPYVIKNSFIFPVNRDRLKGKMCSKIFITNLHKSQLIQTKVSFTHASSLILSSILPEKSFLRQSPTSKIMIYEE